MTTYERYNLVIDSSKRQNTSESTTNFSVNLTNGYTVKMARFKRASIPLTFYNITSANNVLSYSFYDININQHTYTITIPIGRYSWATLTNAIHDQLALQPSTYGVLDLTFNYLTGLFTFTASGYAVVMLFSGAFLSATQLLSDLGFIPTIANPSVSSTKPIKFFNTEYLQLTINYLGSSIITVDNNQSNTTFILEMNPDFTQSLFGTKLNITNPNDDTGATNNVYTNPIVLQSFKVTLSDKNNNPIDLNGYDWLGVIELIVVVDNQLSTPSQLTTATPPNDPNNTSYMNDAKAKTTSVTNNSIPYWMRF